MERLIMLHANIITRRKTLSLCAGAKRVNNVVGIVKLLITESCWVGNSWDSNF